MVHSFRISAVLIGLLSVFCAVEGLAQAPFALVRDDGSVEFRLPNRERVGQWKLYMHGQDWRQAHTDSTTDRQESHGEGWRSIGGKLAVPTANGRALRYIQKFVETDAGMDIFVDMRFRREVALNTCSVALFWEVPALADQEAWVGNGGGASQRVSLPGEFRGLLRWHGMADELRLPGAMPLTLKLDQPVSLTIQDNREYGLSTFEFRFNFIADNKAAAGEHHATRASIRFEQPTRVILDETSATSKTDTSDWYAWSCPWDAAPVDLSFLNDRPAGSHGFLTAKGDRLLFQDGVEARFWGTNISAEACFPDKVRAPVIAERMARYGLNLVRFHHGDAPWSSRSFIDYQQADSQHIDTANLDRYHFFAAELRKRGIYIYLDNLVHRQFKAGDGVAAAAELPPAGKPYALFDRRLIELQKAYARELWTRVNPYTQLAPCNDPQYVLSEYSNEHDFFSQEVTLEPYRTQFEEKYREWAGEQKLRLPTGTIDFTRPDETMVRFFQAMQQAYHTEMRSFFRDELNVRFPLTGSNWARTTSLLWTLRGEDYTEAHAYADHPWGAELRVRNLHTTAERRNIFAQHTFNRLAGKPFIAAEWDQSWPNEWRAELPLQAAAVAALQGWNGMMVYTYRHNFQPAARIEAPFEAALDPARFGLFPHAALLYRRDVMPAAEVVTVGYDEKAVHAADGLAEWDQPAGLTVLPEKHRVEMTFADLKTSKLPSATESQVAPDATSVRSDTDQLWRSWEVGYGSIDTPGTQAVYGQRGMVTAVTLSDVAVDVLPRFATVAVSSLSESPIRQSDQLLVTAVARAENTGMVYNLFRTLCVEAGKAPILVEPVHGEIAITTERTGLQVFAMGPRGELREKIPSTCSDGTLRFRIGENVQALSYRIVPMSMK